MSLANTEESGATKLPEGGCATARQGDARPYPAYRILLHHDGQAYVAEVPELDTCKGTGDSPAAALRAAEYAIVAWLQNAGVAAPALLHPTDLLRKIKERLAAAYLGQTHAQRMSPVKSRLVEKFGKMSNRALAGRIGLSGRDAPTMVSAAASGKGTRKARCAIALALGELPSRLWPDRVPGIGADDDDMFLQLQKQGIDPSAGIAQHQP